MTVLSLAAVGAALWVAAVALEIWGPSGFGRFLAFVVTFGFGTGFVVSAITLLVRRCFLN